MTENAMDDQRQHSTEPAEGAEPEERAADDAADPREHTEERAEGDDD